MLLSSSITLTPIANMHARELYDFSTRQQMSHRIKKLGKVAVMLQRSTSSSSSVEPLKPLDRKSYALPGDVTWTQLIWYVRKLLEKQQKFSAASALFLFCEQEVESPNEETNKKGIYKMYMVSGSCTITCVQASYMHKDGFIYVYYSSENVFG